MVVYSDMVTFRCLSPFRIHRLCVLVCFHTTMTEMEDNITALCKQQEGIKLQMKENTVWICSLSLLWKLKICVIWLNSSLVLLDYKIAVSFCVSSTSDQIKTSVSLVLHKWTQRPFVHWKDILFCNFWSFKRGKPSLWI